jgi:hypothetical protein
VENAWKEIFLNVQSFFDKFEWLHFTREELIEKGYKDDFICEVLSCNEYYYFILFRIFDEETASLTITEYEHYEGETEEDWTIAPQKVKTHHEYKIKSVKPIEIYDIIREFYLKMF